MAHGGSQTVSVAQTHAGELAFAEILDREGILYEREKIFLNGDRSLLVPIDFGS